MELKHIIADNLKYYRHNFKETQDTFAKVLDTTKSYLSQIENAKIDITLDTIDKYIKNINKHYKTDLSIENLLTNDKYINKNKLKANKILAINLKYYRKKYNKNQNDFSDILDIDYARLCEIENAHLNLKISSIDKFVKNINNYDPNINLTTNDLLKYNEKHLTNFKRIDEKIIPSKKP